MLSSIFLMNPKSKTLDDGKIVWTSGSGVKVDPGKGIWRFSRKDLAAASGDWDAGQIDFVLHADNGVSCWDPHWNVSCRRDFDFNSKKQRQTPASITGTAMAALGAANFADLPIVRLAVVGYEAACQLDAQQKLLLK